MKVFRIALVALLGTAGAASSQAPAPAPTADRMVPTLAPPGPYMANVDLGKEFPEMPQLKGYSFTQSYTTVAPNTGRPLHSHKGQPEIVRILSGTLTDARNGGKPIEYGPGSTIVNAEGTQHMWANFGKEPVVFVATTIRPPAK